MDIFSLLSSIEFPCLDRAGRCSTASSISSLVIAAIISLVIFYRSRHIREQKLFVEKIMKKFAKNNDFIFRKIGSIELIKKSLIFTNDYYRPRFRFRSNTPVAVNYIEGIKKELKIILFNYDSHLLFETDFPGNLKRSCIVGIFLEYVHNLPKMIINKSNLESNYAGPELAKLITKPSKGFIKKNIANNLDIYALKEDYDKNKIIIDKIVYLKDWLLDLSLKSFQIEMLESGILIYFSEPFEELTLDEERLNQIVDKLTEFVKSIKM